MWIIKFILKVFLTVTRKKNHRIIFNALKEELRHSDDPFKIVLVHLPDVLKGSY